MNFFFSKLSGKTTNLYLCKYKDNNLINYLNNLTKFNNIDLNFLNKFVNKVFIRGLKKKISKILNYFFFNFYILINNNNSDNNYFLYFYYNEIKSLYNNNIYIKNPIFLLSWIFSMYYFILNIKVVKKKKITSYSIDFLRLDKRPYFFMFFFKMFNFSKLNLKNNLNFFMLDSILNFKQSFLYKKKIKLYKFYINS